MIKSRKSKHVDFVRDRMMELHNIIVQEIIWQEDPDMELIENKKALLKKYRRRINLIKT